MVDTLMNNAPAGSIGECTSNGWTDTDCFLKWLKHFLSIVKACPEEKHILILDGHHRYKTLDAVEYARVHGIERVTLPPHCTHKMHPLDRTFLKALKSGYNLAAATWMVANPVKSITLFEMAGIFSTAYNKTATIKKAVNGFRACGLWPFNDQIFDEEDCLDMR